MGGPWPEAVVESIRRKDLVLVIGAGVSMASTCEGVSPPSWKGLLRELCVAAGSSAEELSSCDELLQLNATLEAAELVQSIASENGKLKDMQTHIKRLVDGRHRLQFQGNEWHDALLMLEPNIIVTTNYDNIIERASRHGYSTHSYKSLTIGQEVRRGDPVLIKVHGSVDDPEHLILTQRDYSRLQNEARHALDVISALFLTRVALFVGYSLSDPDIRLLLENTVGGRMHAPSHYILAEDSLTGYKRRIFEEAFGVSPVTYPAGDHRAGLKLLWELGAALVP